MTASAVGTLTTTATTIDIKPATSLQGVAFDGFAYFRRIIYTNTTAGPITVTVNRGLAGAGIVWQSLIAAGATDVFDPGGNTVCDISGAANTYPYQHKASAGASINALVMGGY